MPKLFIPNGLRLRIPSLTRWIGVLLLVLWASTRVASLRAIWLRNQAAIAFTKSQLAPAPAPLETDAMRLLELSAQSGSGAAHAYHWLGRVYLDRTEYSQAQEAFEHALEEGADDSMLWLRLAQSYTGRGDLDGAIYTLLDGLLQRPFDEAIYLELQHLYDQHGVRFTAKAGWTDVPHVQIAPDQTLCVPLSLPAVRPRRLRVLYFDYPKRDLTVNIDGQYIGEIRGKGGDWQSRYFLLPLSAGDTVNVELKNASVSSAFALAGLQLEYVSNVERFYDIAGSSWSDQPYKGLEPQGRYETVLYLPAEQPRTVVLNFFAFPERYLTVFVNGTKLGTLGEEQHEAKPKGWTDFSFPLPDTLPALLKVILVNPSLTHAAAVRYIALMCLEK